ncbi:MAG: hypothetical protein AAF092_05175 [Pseudomonadota bacterium]
MEIASIAGATRVIGEGQGYLGLPILDAKIDCAVNGPDTPTMTTAWRPSAEELKALANGAPIYVTLLGRAHPPIMLGVGPEPDAAST